MQQTIVDQQAQSNRLLNQTQEQLSSNKEISQNQATLIENLTATVQEQQSKINMLEQQRMLMEQQLQQQQSSIQQVEQQITNQDLRFTQAQSEQAVELDEIRSGKLAHVHQ